MSLDNPRAGYNLATEYQSSALPWLTSSTAPAAGSPVRYDFPRVTRFITLINRDAITNTLSLGFTRNGVIGNNKIIVPANTQVSLELRITSLYIQGESGTPAYSLCVGLTNVGAIEMPQLTGSLNGTPMWDGVG